MSKINIFISHTSKDHDFVWELAKRMKKDLKDIVEIFVDDWEIDVGDSIVRKIDEATQKTDFFIIVLSKHSIRQEWVKTEIDIAITKLNQKKAKILPIWLEISEEEIPYILLRLKAAVFKTKVIIDEEEYRKLIEPILNHEKAKSLLKFQESVLDDIKHLDLILQKEIPTRHEIQFALGLIKVSPVYEKYFFSKLRSLELFDILKSEGFFSPEKAPAPRLAGREGFYTIPYWSVLNYLEIVSKQIGSSSNMEYADKLLGIIKEVTEYHRETKKLDNYRIWSSFIRIFANLPKEKVSEEFIDLIPVWLDSNFGVLLQVAEIKKTLFPRFLTDNQSDIRKAELIIKHLTGIKKQGRNKFLKVEPYLLKEFFEEHLNITAEKCTVKVIKILANRMEQLVSSEHDGTFYSLYDYEEEEFFLGKPVELFSYIVSKILTIKTKREPENVRQILESFFEEQHPVFTKVSLFVIGQNIDAFKELLWEIFKIKGEKIFEGAAVHWGDELKKVLENLGPLDNAQRELLKEKIEIATENYAETLEDENEEEKRKWKAVFRQKIYKALSHDEEFKALYDESKEKTGMSAELKPAIEKIEVKEGWGKSPLSVERILEMDNTEIAEYLVKFKTENFWEGPTAEALAETLQTAVETKPSKFIGDFEPFLKVDYLYTSRILKGLKEALSEGKSINYEKILDFINEYIKRNEFWQDKLTVESLHPAKHTQVINAICFFITEMLQNKAFQLSGELFKKIEEIIHLIIENSKPEKTGEKYDYVSYSLNTPLGRVIETYIKFVLTFSQSPYDNGGSTIKNFIEKYSELLNKSIIEAYTFFGMYLLNFYFRIDKDFTEEVVKFLKPEEKTWEAFMEGYLFGQFNKEVYLLMKKHLESGLLYDFKNKISEENLVGHISLAYLIGLESLKSPSLFYKLIKKLELSKINEIINLFWRQKRYLQEENEINKRIERKILDFWGFIYSKLKDKKEFSSDEKEILSNIIKLTVFIPELTEPYTDWLKFSAQFIKDTSAFSFFLGYLERFIEANDRDRVAKILSEILLAAPVFEDPENKIEVFIKYFCETHNDEVKKRTINICEKYMRHESFLLKEACEKCD